MLKIQGAVTIRKWSSEIYGMTPFAFPRVCQSLCTRCLLMFMYTTHFSEKLKKKWNTKQFQRKRKPGLKIVFPILHICVHLLPPEVKGGDIDKVVLPSPTCRTCPTCQARPACPACCPPLLLATLLGPHHFTLESDFEWLSSSVRSLWATTDMCHRFYRTESELAPKLVTR